MVQVPAMPDQGEPGGVQNTGDGRVLPFVLPDFRILILLDQLVSRWRVYRFEVGVQNQCLRCSVIPDDPSNQKQLLTCIGVP